MILIWNSPALSPDWGWSQLWLQRLCWGWRAGCSVQPAEPIVCQFCIKWLEDKVSHFVTQQCVSFLIHYVAGSPALMPSGLQEVCVCVCVMVSVWANKSVSLHNLERQSSGFPSLQMPGDEYLLSHPFYPCSPHHFLCLSPSPSLSRTSLSILSALLCPLCFVLLSSLFFVPPVCFFLDSILLD